MNKEYEESIIELWFHEHHDTVFNFLVYRLRNRDVEDLVQEVFVRAMTGLSRFRGESQPLTWLISIAKSVASDYTRRTRRADTFINELKYRQTWSDNVVESVVLRRETYLELVHALSRLRKSYRDVVVLRELLQMSAKETGEILGWTVPKVNVTLHRAHQKLRKHLELQPNEYFVQNESLPERSTRGE